MKRPMIVAIIVAAALAGCARPAATPTPAAAPALPSRFGQPVVKIDLPPGLDVAERSVRVNYASFRPVSAHSARTEIWFSPELVLLPAGTERLSDGRTRRSFSAPAERVTKLRNLPAVTDHPDASIGYSLRLCRTGAALADGPLIVTSQFILPPLTDGGEISSDVRADKQVWPRIAACNG